MSLIRFYSSFWVLIADLWQQSISQLSLAIVFSPAFGLLGYVLFEQVRLLLPHISNVP